MAAFFVLMPGSWPEADAHLCRPLVGGRADRGEHTPFVAVARGVRHGRHDLVPQSGLTGGDRLALIAEARAASDQRPRTWQVVSERGFLFWKRPSVVRAVLSQPAGSTPDPMDDLSSEQILNPKALAEAAGRLGSEDLLAVVPKRGWLLVLPGTPGEIPQMMIAYQVASAVFGDAGADALSPYAFFARVTGAGPEARGRLIGLNVFDGISGYLSLIEPSDEEWRL